jgi:hypothetical protein
MAVRLFPSIHNPSDLICEVVCDSYHIHLRMLQHWWSCRCYVSITGPGRGPSVLIQESLVRPPKIRGRFCQWQAYRLKCGPWHPSIRVLCRTTNHIGQMRIIQRTPATPTGHRRHDSAVVSQLPGSQNFAMPQLRHRSAFANGKFRKHCICQNTLGTNN